VTGATRERREPLSHIKRAAVQRQWRLRAVDARGQRGREEARKAAVQRPWRLRQSQDHGTEGPNTLCNSHNRNKTARGGSGGGGGTAQFAANSRRWHCTVGAYIKQYYNAALILQYYYARLCGYIYGVLLISMERRKVATLPTQCCSRFCPETRGWFLREKSVKTRWSVGTDHPEK